METKAENTRNTVGKRPVRLLKSNVNNEAIIEENTEVRTNCGFDLIRSRSEGIDFGITVGFGMGIGVGAEVVQNIKLSSWQISY